MIDLYFPLDISEKKEEGYEIGKRSRNWIFKFWIVLWVILEVKDIGEVGVDVISFVIGSAGKLLVKEWRFEIESKGDAEEVWLLLLEKSTMDCGLWGSKGISMFKTSFDLINDIINYN